MAITSDGVLTPENGYSSANRLSANALTCTQSGNVIFVGGIFTDGAVITDVQDEAGNAFTSLKVYSTTRTELWARYYAGVFNSKIRVITSFAAGYGMFTAQAINGLQSATLDANASSTASGGSSPISVSSNGAAGVIVAMCRTSSSGVAVPGSGWTATNPSTDSFAFMQWRAFSGGALSGFSCAAGSGGSVNGMVAAVLSDVVAGPTALPAYYYQMMRR